MNSAHNSLLQWLQENPKRQMAAYCHHNWVIHITMNGIGIAFGFGPSYEAACHDLMQQLRKL